MIESFVRTVGCNGTMPGSAIAGGIELDEASRAFFVGVDIGSPESCGDVKP